VNRPFNCGSLSSIGARRWRHSRRDHFLGGGGTWGSHPSNLVELRRRIIHCCAISRGLTPKTGRVRMFRHYRTRSSSRRQSLVRRRSTRLVTPSSNPCCWGECMYQGERGAGARPNCSAREAMSTSDEVPGSKVTTAKPAVVCTFSDAALVKHRSRASRQAA